LFPIRLTEDDLPHTKAQEVGLYAACLECVAEHRQRVAERLHVELTEITNNAMC
jgi:hypothetical protein